MESNKGKKVNELVGGEIAFGSPMIRKDGQKPVKKEDGSIHVGCYIFTVPEHLPADAEGKISKYVEVALTGYTDDVSDNDVWYNCWLEALAFTMSPEEEAAAVSRYETERVKVPNIGSLYTNNESLSSLPGSVVRLNGESRMVEVIRANGETMSFGGNPAIEAFAADVGLNEADTNQMFNLEALAKALGKSGKAIDDVLVVTDGRHIGPVLGMADGKALIDAGRGNLVGLDTTTLEKPPKAGDRVDVSLSGGIVKAFKNLGDELSKDGQAVSVSIHTGR